MKILVIHYDKLLERKIHILEEFKNHNITDFEFVSNYGKDTLTNEQKMHFINLRDSEISLLLNHFECYRRIVEKYDYALIFEDDVILADNFKNTIENYVSQLPDDWDMLFIGNGCNLHIPQELINSKSNIYRKETKDSSSRCSDSYLISKNCCKKYLEYISSPNYIISVAIDHLVNIINRDNNFNVYWAEPTIVVQGTQIKRFQSSIQSSNNV